MGDTLFDCYLVAEGSMAFELERCGGMNTCTTPRPCWKMPGYLSPRLSLQHSARGREEKSCAAEKGKYPRDVSRVVSLGSGVRCRHCGGMSGVKWSRRAGVGLVKCLPGDLLTCSQVGTQSSFSTRSAKQDGDQRGKTGRGERC